ncbi:MAG: hypothetical protein B6I19_05395, partial [Bacteroidetes bacterium 4572_114]
IRGILKEKEKKKCALSASKWQSKKTHDRQAKLKGLAQKLEKYEGRIFLPQLVHSHEGYFPELGQKFNQLPDPRKYLEYEPQIYL